MLVSGAAAAVFWLCVGLVVYTYAGYPLLLWILARLKRRAPVRSDTTPSVTLLIAAYNEAASIAAKLKNSVALDYPRGKLQILVAADGSDDDTPAIVRSFVERGVELSYVRPRKGKTAAIDRAMPLVRGEVIVISDTNNLYDPNALRELVQPFADPSVGAVSGAKHVMSTASPHGASEGLYWKYEDFVKRNETRLSSCTGAVGEILAIRRELYEPPPEHVVTEDFYLAMRIVKRDLRVAYAPTAESWEPAAPSARVEMERRARIVAGRYQALALASRLLPWRRPLIVWQAVSHKFLRPLIPFALLGALAANVVAVFARPALKGWAWLELAPPVGGWLLAAQGLFYALALLGPQFKRLGKAGRILYLPTFLVSSNLAAVVGLYRFLAKRQSVLWKRAPREGNPMTLEPGAWERDG